VRDSRSLSEAGYRAISTWEWRAFLLLLVTFAIYGLVVEKRSAFMKRHMTDLGVYLRVGWAVRAGEDIYDVIDDNGWHYQYPPLFAILMVPLADPPPGVDRAGTLPFWASVGLWYLFSLACLTLAVHWLASALEERYVHPELGRMPRGCWRWWALRLIPILGCLTPIGHTLMRGQVNLLLLFFVSAMTAAWLRGRSGQAGLWLAAAICLKVIPAFLVLIPLWRRDWRCLGSCGLGLFVGLGVVPAAVFGLPRTLAYYEEYDQKLLRPAMGKGSDQSRAKELIEMTANDSQSILAAIHNTIYPDRLQRPPHPSMTVRWAHRVLCGVMTLVVLWAAGWRRATSAAATVLFAGVLTLTMVLMSPVCHLHYFCLSVIPVVGLIAAAWERHGRPRLGLWLFLLLVVNVVANALPHLPGLELFREVGLAMYPALLIWGVGCVELWRQTRAEAWRVSAIMPIGRPQGWRADVA
jgi:alpha-1,2-mannosyltransferase